MAQITKMQAWGIEIPTKMNGNPIIDDCPQVGVTSVIVLLFVSHYNGLFDVAVATPFADGPADWQFRFTTVPSNLSY